MQENHVRSVIKGASWRIVGTLDTILLSYIYTGQPGKALKIGGIELFTKIFLFYLGSLDTFWIALFVNSDSAHATQTAFYIAATEVITKVGLFWLHERVWMRVKWGAKPEQILQPGQ